MRFTMIVSAMLAAMIAVHHAAGSPLWGHLQNTAADTQRIVTAAAQNSSNSTAPDQGHPGDSGAPVTVVKQQSPPQDTPPGLAAAEDGPWRDVTIAKTLLPGVEASAALSSDDDIRAAMRAVDESYDYATDGAIRFRVARITDWVRSNTPCSSPDQLWADVAQQTGWQRRDRNHLVLYIPAEADCQSWGEAELGGSPDSGGMLYVSDPTFPAATTAHELGHNMGLMHAQTFARCDQGISDGIGPVGLRTGGCEVAEYGDSYDVMGDPTGDSEALRTMNLSPIHTEYLGLRDKDFRNHSQSIVLKIGNAAWDYQPDAPRYPVVTSPQGTRYYLEYRSATGKTSWIAEESLGTGGVLLRVRDTHPASVHNSYTRGILLDAPAVNGERASAADRFLTSNHPEMPTARQDLSFQVVAQNDAYATVVVRRAGVTPAVDKPHRTTNKPWALAATGQTKTRAPHDIPTLGLPPGSQQKRATQL